MTIELFVISLIGFIFITGIFCMVMSFIYDNEQPPTLPKEIIQPKKILSSKFTFEDDTILDGLTNASEDGGVIINDE